MIPLIDEKNLKRLKYAFLFMALFYILIYIVIIVSRADYKYELEWMEGGVLEHVIRFLDGKNIYSEPSIEFTPYIYTPLYYGRF